MAEDDGAKQKLDPRIIERVRKLIDLAASPNQKEAERAAYMACQQIRELGLDIIDPDELNGTFEELAATQAKVKQLEAGQPINQTGDLLYARPLRTAAVRIQFDPDDLLSQAGVPQRGDPSAAPVDIFAKINSRCRQCRKELHINDPIRWIKDVGAWCRGTSCYADWKMAQQGSPFAGFDINSILNTKGS